MMMAMLAMMVMLALANFILVPWLIQYAYFSSVTPLFGFNKIITNWLKFVLNVFLNKNSFCQNHFITVIFAKLPSVLYSDGDEYNGDAGISNDLGK